MPSRTLPNDLATRIDDVVSFYASDAVQNLCTTFLNQFRGHVELCAPLQPLIHSIKYRIKSADHLKDKLERKAREGLKKGRQLKIDRGNLFRKVTDCAGFRIMHLHTRQIELLDPAIRELLLFHRYEILEGPVANVWDDDAASYYRKLGFKVRRRPDSMYTSVHYVIAWNAAAECTCELQVRTLSEELWGEVDHAIKYPHDKTSEACREQLKVLARLSSGVTRLVDVIFAGHSEYVAQLGEAAFGLVEKVAVASAGAVAAVSGAVEIRRKKQPKTKGQPKTKRQPKMKEQPKRSARRLRPR